MKSGGFTLWAAFRGALAITLAAAPACERQAGGAAPAKGAGGGGGAPVPVALGHASKRDKPVLIRTIGTIEPVATVTIKPQISGQLTGVNFIEGQEVKAGQLLLMIDPRPYEAALRESEANLVKNKAIAEDAEETARQMAEALQGAAATSREVNRTRAVAASARAEAAASQAQIDTARLNLEYCSIKSPIDGRAGVLLVKNGNVVKANETELFQINQLAPINVTFAVPEQNLGAIHKGKELAELPVEVTVPGEEGAPVKGVLTFIDNKVDTMTGTIRLRGTFENADRHLWPGQFVNVSLTIGVDKGAVVVPSEAVQIGQQGQYVFVVKDGNKVELRPVTIARSDAAESVVSKGLVGDETVVTDGQLRLLPGSTIQPKDKGAKVQKAEEPVAGPQEKTGP